MSLNYYSSTAIPELKSPNVAGDHLSA